MLHGTNPQEIEELWRHIRNHLATYPPKLSTAWTETGEVTCPGEYDPIYDPMDWSAPDSPKPAPSPNPEDADFKKHVLKPRNIFMIDKLKDVRGVSALQHAIRDLSDPNMRDEGERMGLRSSSKRNEGVLVDVCNAFEEWNETTEVGIKKEALSDIEALLFADPAVPTSWTQIWSRQPAAKERKAERVQQLRVKYSERCHWHSPPILSQSAAGIETMHETAMYDFDVRPTYSFFLSLQSCSAEQKSEVGRHAFVAKNRATAPYLIVESLKFLDLELSGVQFSDVYQKYITEKEKLTLENRVAATMAVALWNRFLLHIKAVRTGLLHPLHRDVEEIRVYGIAWTLKGYDIWCATPRVTSSKILRWEGCVIEKVGTGVIGTRGEGVEELQEWVKRIHCWGLGRHADAFWREIEACARGYPDYWGGGWGSDDWDDQLIEIALAG